MKKLQPNSRKTAITLILFLFISSLCSTYAQDSKANIPEKKQTSLKLYVNSKEAYDMWKSNPENVNILDVRTAEEYLYIGHAAMAWNVPMFFQSYEWDAEKKHFPMSPNPDFISEVKKVLNEDDIILVTCRSGGRSAIATNKLAEAGFTNVYNIIDGFEGDHVSDTNSVFLGYRMVNGWKNSGLPYTNKIEPKLMLIP